MEKIKKAYYYFFYKIYKSIEYTSEWGGGKFWTDFKAGLVIIALEIWILFSIFNIYSLVRNEKIKIEISHPVIIVPLILILLLNYLSFVHTNKWKEYNEEFARLPRRKNIIGGIIVWIIIILIVAVYWTSAYLMQKYVLGK
ncbi:MAG: hypothetical protein RBT46_07990 [Weeksellaceae bacterium]|jgi:hypothetical protein|nr:hypothetical protein [Weeksellaceae bacterium]